MTRLWVLTREHGSYSDYSCTTLGIYSSPEAAYVHVIADLERRNRKRLGPQKYSPLAEYDFTRATSAWSEDEDLIHGTVWRLTAEHRDRITFTATGFDVDAAPKV